MHADLKGALMHVNRYWHLFEHNGASLSKKQVKYILKYGIDKGYDKTSDFKEGEIDNILKNKLYE